MNIHLVQTSLIPDEGQVCVRWPFEVPASLIFGFCAREGLDAQEVAVQSRSC